MNDQWTELQITDYAIKHGTSALQGQQKHLFGDPWNCVLHALAGLPGSDVELTKWWTTIDVYVTDHPDAWSQVQRIVKLGML